LASRRVPSDGCRIIAAGKLVVSDKMELLGAALGRTPQQARRAMQAMFTMKKLDIAALEQAREG
jgi:hypothetical protein